MNWTLFFTTFVTIFLAELGDKTQFAAIAASSEADSTKEVLLAVVLALSIAGVIGVLLGKVLAHFINPEIMRYVSGSLFIVVGLWVIFKK
jgi:putative Ca2+/H+ antiporter (TMEM165/GDT1 family)